MLCGALLLLFTQFGSNPIGDSEFKKRASFDALSI
jgi:hypothetical protein